MVFIVQVNTSTVSGCFVVGFSWSWQWPRKCSHGALPFPRRFSTNERSRKSVTGHSLLRDLV